MTKHLRPLVVCLAVLGAPLGLAACDVKVGGDGDLSFDVTHGRANDEWVRSYTIAKGGRLEISSGGGPVEVTASAGPEVEVRIVRQAQASTDEAAQEGLKLETIAEEVAPDRVRVETKRQVANNTGPMGRRRISTEYHVRIPAGLNVSIKGENADITLKSVDGNFTLENTNGGFRADALSGTVSAATVNGAVDLDFAEVKGDVKATTVNGMVRVSLHQDANVSVEATTVNGGVVIADELKFTPTVRERLRVEGRVNAGGPKMVLQTTNGPVRVRLTGRAARGGANRGEPVVIERQLQR